MLGSCFGLDKNVEGGVRCGLPLNGFSLFVGAIADGVVVVITLGGDSLSLLALGGDAS